MRKYLKYIMNCNEVLNRPIDLKMIIITSKSEFMVWPMVTRKHDHYIVYTFVLGFYTYTNKKN